MKNLWLQLGTLIAVILGIALGVLFPGEYECFGQAKIGGCFSLLGELFLDLLKLLVIPLIAVSIFLAISKLETTRELKRLGSKTLLYYLATSSLAVIVSLFLSKIFFTSEWLGDDTMSSINLPGAIENPTSLDLIGALIPSNIFSSLSDGKIVHIVIFTIIFAIAFVYVKQESKVVIIGIAETLYEVIMKLVNWVLQLAPLGILSLVWTAVGKFDTSLFDVLIPFFWATGIAASIHMFITLPFIGFVFARTNMFKFFLSVKEALLVALVTASSAATLPVSTKVMESTGVDKKTTGFVLPLGATLNMDGSALYQALLATLFIHLAPGIEPSLLMHIQIFLLVVLSSAGTAGIPSGGIVMMILVLETLGISDYGLYIGIYLMVDRFWDYPITMINVFGDMVGAKTVHYQLNK